MTPLAISRRTCNVDSLERSRLSGRTRFQALRQTFFHQETVSPRVRFHTRREILVGDGVVSQRGQTSSMSPPILPEESSLMPWPYSHCHNSRTPLSSPRDPSHSSPSSL